MLRALELSEDDEQRIAETCTAANITYMSTPFDADSATHLVKRIGVSTLKVGSGDLTNAPLLLHLARFRLPIILSTGMATLAEIEQALGVIAFGYMRDTTQAAGRGFRRNPARSRKSWTELRGKVTLLHCTTEYPAELAFDQSARDGDFAERLRTSGRLLRSQPRYLISRPQRSRWARP